MKIETNFYHKLKFILHNKIQEKFSSFYLYIILNFKKINIFSSFFLYTKIKFDKKNKINIVFQNKGVFNEEVIYLFKGIDNINLIRLNRPILKKLLNFAYNGKKINHKNWYQEKEITKNKAKYIELLKRFVGIPKFNIFIIFNWGDGSTYEYTEYLKKYNIPTICLHKEGILSIKFRESYLKILNKSRVRFEGKKILVYNKEIKKTLLENKYHDEQIDVVGSVRFDDIYALSNEIIDQKKVTLFHPSINAQLPDLLGLKASFDWEEVINIFYNNLFKLIELFPSVVFILKIKKRDIENIKKYISGSFDNLIIDNSTSSISLLKNSKLCIGFNTTGLLEAAAFRIPVINCVPERLMQKYRDFIIDYKSLVINTSDLKLMIKLIEKNILRMQFDNIQKKDFEEIVGNSNGKAKKNIVKSILSLIENDKF